MSFSGQIFVPRFQAEARKKDGRAPRRVQAYTRSASCSASARGCLVTRVRRRLRLKKTKKTVSSTLFIFFA